MKRLILLLLILLSTFFIIPKTSKASESLAANSKAAILIEAESGDILFLEIWMKKEVLPP